MTEMPKPGPQFAQRSPQDLDVDYWTLRLRIAKPDEKLYCARQLVAKKRARGDFDLVQEPMTHDTAEALAKQVLLEQKDPDQVGELTRTAGSESATTHNP